ncbi:MAG: hypothetical protein Q7J16_03625 [Candidatus Cloacimonadales bacterium]|nr:hypothetical protein [Candidatus Cloacimonadales bacterium]
MNKRKELGMPLVEDFHLAKDEFMKALAKENIDEEELQTIIDNLIYKQSMMEKEIGNSMIELRKELSSEEAKEVFGKFRKWMQPPEHMHREKNWPGPPHRK